MLNIISKFFGKKKKVEKNQVNDISLEKTSKMLDESKFWDIIDLSLRKSKTQDEQESFLIKELETLNLHEIIGFRLRTDKLLYDTYNSEMWCAGYIMNGGCSDDSFEYFRNWIISRGKDVYYNSKKDPDTLIKETMDDQDYYDFESFWYVALTAFQNKTGKDLYDFIADDFTTNEANYPKIEFNWEEEKPDTMKAICPKLFEKFWK